jgi:hypothetical protein
VTGVLDQTFAQGRLRAGPNVEEGSSDRNSPGARKTKGFSLKLEVCRLFSWDNYLKTYILHPGLKPSAQRAEIWKEAIIVLPLKAASLHKL